MTTYYHGCLTDTLPRHAGLCLTLSESAARQYGRSCAGRQGYVHTVEIDEDALVIVDVDGYDHDTNTAPGDTARSRAALIAEYGCDAIRFEDEDETGRTHTTLRLLTDAALAAIVG